METEYYSIDEDTVCGICLAEFLDVDDLQRHVTQYHLSSTDSSNCCPFCTQVSSDLDNFALHMRNEHFSLIKCCKYCTRFFLDAELLSNHETKHRYTDLNPKLACSQCNYVFNDKNKLESHEYSQHRLRDDSIMLCDAYPMLSSALNMNIKLFVQSLHENSLFGCSRCGMTTFDVSAYIQHLVKENKRCLACDVCYDVFKNKEHLLDHCKKHTSAETSPVKVLLEKQCERCKKFFSASNLRLHLKMCMDMKCSTCNLSFDSVTTFAGHMASHSAEKTVPLQICKYCQRPLVGVDALEKHIERQHKHEIHLYKYHCKNCDKIFKHPKALFGHFFSRHKDIKPYICKICNISFRVRKNFTVHIKLDHKSVGFVEFNDDFHVYFTDRRSNKSNKNQDETDKSEEDKEVIAEGEDDGTKRMSREIITEVTIEEMITEPESENPATETSPKTVNMDEIEIIDESEEQNCGEDDKKEIGSNKMINTEETNGSQLESNMTEPRVKLKHRKFIRKPKKCKVTSSDFSSDDSDTPLLTVLKRRALKKRFRRIPRKFSNKFVCKKCKRNCYTYQNYHRHLALHKKSERKTCIKCQNTFKYESQLRRHIQEQHSSSELTETLKKLLQRKSNVDKTDKVGKGVAEKAEEAENVSENRMEPEKPAESDKWNSSNSFRSTVKRVHIERQSGGVTITPIQKDKLSAKKFIENFMPENQESKVTISSSLSIKTVRCDKSPSPIKLTKFTPEPQLTGRPKLRMPVSFRRERTEVHDVSIKIVHSPLKPSWNISTGDSGADDANDVPEAPSGNTIPEVGREVMLEGIANSPVQRTIVIKDIQKTNNLRIGHLWPQAPYFKIVKIKDVVKDTAEQEEVRAPETDLTLPNGTKLVTVNPLSHLLGGRRFEDVTRARAKRHCYQPKVKNFGEALAKALMKLDRTPYARKKTAAKGAKSE